MRAQNNSNKSCNLSEITSYKFDKNKKKHKEEQCSSREQKMLKMLPDDTSLSYLRNLYRVRVTETRNINDSLLLKAN